VTLELLLNMVVKISRNSLAQKRGGSVLVDERLAAVHGGQRVEAPRVLAEPLASPLLADRTRDEVEHIVDGFTASGAFQGLLSRASSRRAPK
jgi:hypothetical protein